MVLQNLDHHQNVILFLGPLSTFPENAIQIHSLLLSYFSLFLLDRDSVFIWFYLVLYAGWASEKFLRFDLNIGRLIAPNLCCCFLTEALQRLTQHKYIYWTAMKTSKACDWERGSPARFIPSNPNTVFSHHWQKVLYYRRKLQSCTKTLVTHWNSEKVKKRVVIR